MIFTAIIVSLCWSFMHFDWFDQQLHGHTACFRNLTKEWIMRIPICPTAIFINITDSHQDHETSNQCQRIKAILLCSSMPFHSLNHTNDLSLYNHNYLSINPPPFTVISLCLRWLTSISSPPFSLFISWHTSTKRDIHPRRRRETKRFGQLYKIKFVNVKHTTERVRAVGIQVASIAFFCTLLQK